eukprot:CAMPEP_0174730952 /NCGR_PEP_ID=MMETSP1094-20130205/56577_1 /TAXON_ID=156173 /ORGANISM="Chrysochromulina brevifilum, Strain UTEX LB 985" /LENGTH=53 /DNA_ID=CAMNT_0015933279 /DNA_START=138 /DNA_END=299 /DNA_ORIENTATION=-
MAAISASNRARLRTSLPPRAPTKLKMRRTVGSKAASSSSKRTVRVEGRHADAS